MPPFQREVDPGILKMLTRDDGRRPRAIRFAADDSVSPLGIFYTMRVEGKR